MRLRRSQRLSDFWREDPLLLIYIKPVRRTFLPETGEEDPARASRPLSRPEDALSRPALLLGGDSSRKAPFELYYYYYCLRERAKRGAPEGGTARLRRDRRSHPRRAGRLLLLLLLARGPSTGSTSICTTRWWSSTDGRGSRSRPSRGAAPPPPQPRDAGSLSPPKRIAGIAPEGRGLLGGHRQIRADAGFSRCLPSRSTAKRKASPTARWARWPTRASRRSLSPPLRGGAGALPDRRGKGRAPAVRRFLPSGWLG